MEIVIRISHTHYCFRPFPLWKAFENHRCISINRDQGFYPYLLWPKCLSLRPFPFALSSRLLWVLLLPKPQSLSSFGRSNSEHWQHRRIVCESSRADNLHGEDPRGFRFLSSDRPWTHAALLVDPYLYGFLHFSGARFISIIVYDKQRWPSFAELDVFNMVSFEQ